MIFFTYEVLPSPETLLTAWYTDFQTFLNVFKYIFILKCSHFSIHYYEENAIFSEVHGLPGDLQVVLPIVTPPSPPTLPLSIVSTHMYNLYAKPHIHREP